MRHTAPPAWRCPLIEEPPHSARVGNPAMANFTLPAVAEGRDWLALIDTSQPEGQLASFPFGHNYAVTGRSLAAFGLSAEDRTTRRFHQGMGSILEVIETPLSGPESY